MAIYNNGQLYPIIFNTITENYVTNIKQTNNFALTARNQSDNIVLTKFTPPFLSFIPEGIYWADGVSVRNCVPFTINGNNSKEQFIQLPGNIDYESITIKLVEPNQTDFKDIQPIWNV